MSFLASAYVVPASRLQDVCKAADDVESDFDEALTSLASREIEYDYQGAGYCVMSAITFLDRAGIDFMDAGGRHPAADRLNERFETGMALVLTSATKSELLPRLRTTKVNVPALVQHHVEMGGEEDDENADLMKAAVRFLHSALAATSEQDVVIVVVAQ